ADAPEPGRARAAGAGHDADDRHRPGVAGLGGRGGLRAEGVRGGEGGPADGGALRQQPAGARGAVGGDVLPVAGVGGRGSGAVRVPAVDDRRELLVPGIRGVGAGRADAVPAPRRRVPRGEDDLPAADAARVRGAAGDVRGLGGPPLHAVPRGADQEGAGGAGGGLRERHADRGPGGAVARGAVRRAGAGGGGAVAPQDELRRAPGAPPRGGGGGDEGHAARRAGGGAGPGAGADRPRRAAADGSGGRAAARRPAGDRG